MPPKVNSTATVEMVAEKHKALLLKRITDIKTDIEERRKLTESTKQSQSIFYATQLNKLKELQDRIEKVEGNFESLCESLTYNEIDGTLTTIRFELNFQNG